MSIRIIVADDHALIRAGITMLLRAETDFEVLGEAADGHETIKLARLHQPDLVLLDARMPTMDGIAATRVLTSESTKSERPTKVLILTTFHDDEVVYGALQAGASGYLLKQAAPRDLIAAVRTVAAGDAWLDPAIAGKVIAAFATLSTPGDGPSQLVTQLTAREREVLTLLAQGMSTTEIKSQLVLSEATVKTHIARILLKTESRDRAQAVVLAYQSGLVSPRLPARDLFL